VTPVVAGLGRGIKEHQHASAKLQVDW